MEEMSQKVQDASSHPRILRTLKAHGQIQRGDGVTVWEGSNCKHPLPAKQSWMSARTANSQFKGAMEEMSQNVQNASSHPINLRTHKAHS